MSRQLFAAARDALRRSAPAAQQYRTTLPAILLRGARLYLLERFSPRESFVWGLADPRLPPEELSRYVSKRRLLRLQARYNSRSRDCLTEDKSVFYPLCAGHGIATPELYAVLCPPGGWCADGSRPNGRRAWVEFLRERLPAAFVIKPSFGVYGQGLRVLERSGAGFRDGSASTSVEQLYDALASDGRYRSFIVQERLLAHPDLVKLSGTEALQTVRMVTWVSPNGTPQLVFATLKIIDGDNASDNFSFGESGNFLADVVAETGEIGDVMAARETGAGLTRIERHPRTGVAFHGFRLPFWAEACALAECAARRFAASRTIGWDVALTPRGPRILEGNMWWDPLQNAHRRIGEFTQMCEEPATFTRSAAGKLRAGDSNHRGIGHLRR